MWRGGSRCGEKCGVTGIDRRRERGEEEEEDGRGKGGRVEGNVCRGGGEG